MLPNFTNINYSWYDIKGVTSVPQLKNMNAYAERLHQGIGKIPDAEIVECTGNIKKLPVLSGLHHHYYRSSA